MRRLAITPALTALILAAQTACFALPPRAKVVVVTMPAVSIEDLASADLPTIRRFMLEGAIGLMNSRTAGRLDAEEGDFVDPRYTPESGYATLGAGARVLAGADARHAFNRDELVEGSPAHLVLERRTFAKSGSAQVVHLGIAKLQRDNADLNYQVDIGLLGTILHAARLKTAVVGNSDSDSPHREAAAICMDGRGLVDLGNVGGEMVTPDPSAPFGVSTDAERLVAAVAWCLSEADLVVIDLGDFARLDRARQDLTPAMFERQKAIALRRADEILERLFALLDPRWVVLIVSPYPSSQAVEETGNSLCPVIAIGNTVSPRGCTHFMRSLLWSGSTRVPGVIANTDIAPSILSWMRIQHDRPLVGRVVSVSPQASPLNALLELNRRVSAQTTVQPVLRQAAVVSTVYVSALTVLWLLIPPGRRKLFRPMALAPAALPLAMLILTPMPLGSQAAAWVGLVLLIGGLVVVSRRIAGDYISALMVISLAFTAGTALDLALGCSLCRYSIMGYSLVEGARYYGIGNEFMGALIGSAAVGLALLLRLLGADKRRTRKVLLGALILGSAFVGTPQLGANVGGAIAVVAAFGVMLLVASEKTLSLRTVTGAVVGAAVVILSFAAVDLLRGLEHESHMGKAIRQALDGGPAQIGMIVKRKVAMNWTLIRFSAWSRLLGAFLISVILAARGPDSRIGMLPFHIKLALAGITGGTLAALLFNDSGVVAAATCAAYGWSLVILVAAEGADKT
jgi:hypothetical protein